MTKQCSKCGEEKPVGEFYKDRTHTDGLTCHCRPCVKDARLEYRSTRREKLRDNARADRKRVPERGIWQSMNHRCHDPKTKAFHTYGGRGIRVCDRWRASFEAFLADMGPRPSPRHSIDRIDVNGNYEPGNCRWATPKEQGRNKRDNRMLTAFGRTQCMAAWAEELGVTTGFIGDRIDELGWSVEEALTTPAAKIRKGGLTVNGRTQSIAAWSREVGLCVRAITERLEHGWSPERAVLTPSQKGRRPYGRKAA